MKGSARGFGQNKTDSRERESRELIKIRDLITQNKWSDVVVLLELHDKSSLDTELLESLAYCYARLNRIQDSIRTYAECKSKNTDISSLFHGAARAARQGRINDSIALHCQLLANSPDHQHGLRNFALVLRRRGDLGNAVTFASKLCQLNPEDSDVWNTYGTVQSGLGRHPEAIKAFKHALSLEPDNALAASNIAYEYHYNADIDNAVLYSSKAAYADPENYGIWLDYYTHLRRSCSLDTIRKIDWWETTLNVSADLTSGSFLMLLALADDNEGNHRFLQCVKRWAKSKEQEFNFSENSRSKSLNRSKKTFLRIGFVSGDFRDHSVARFIWPLFEYLDRSRFQLYCYSTLEVEDSWRERFKQRADSFCEVGHLSVPATSALIQRDEVDILFDLTGFTKGSRTELFSLRSAPMQVSWLGFPGSTGLKNMDYIFLDRFLTPSNKGLITEQPLVTEGTTVCFTDLDEIPITPSIPQDSRGFLTLGTLNNTYKINSQTLDMWSRVMEHLPDSRFLFVRREFESFTLRQNIIREFKRRGIRSERIYFYNNRRESRHYLDTYNEIDMTLDTFPVTGGTTTTDALWMGVPVIGLEGENIHQRVSSSILHHAGHSEWVAKSPGEFIDISVSLGKDIEKRRFLRQALRSQLINSTLCRPKQFAIDFSRAIEHELRTLHRGEKAR